MEGGSLISFLKTYIRFVKKKINIRNKSTTFLFQVETWTLNIGLKIICFPKDSEIKPQMQRSF